MTTAGRRAAAIARPGTCRIFDAVDQNATDSHASSTAERRAGIFGAVVVVVSPATLNPDVAKLKADQATVATTAP
jgi:hypothetical protein